MPLRSRHISTYLYIFGMYSVYSVYHFGLCSYIFGMYYGMRLQWLAMCVHQSLPNPFDFDEILANMNKY